VKQVRTTSDIRQLGTILFIGAHPDDETFMAGGIMAAAVKNGQVVVVATVTRGEAGTCDEARWPSATLGAVREQELSHALQKLGVTEKYIFNCPDGGCAAMRAEPAIAWLKDITQRHQPDTILTFGPEGMTGHPDHQTVSAWANTVRHELGLLACIYHAVQTAESYEKLKPADDVLNLFFNIDKPPIAAEGQCAIAYHLPPDIEDQKRRALLAMPSQNERLFSGLPTAVIDRAFSHEYFVLADSENRAQ
jgi:LmbE family N-acetylglucosaminyl deacetylase